MDIAKRKKAGELAAKAMMWFSMIFVFGMVISVIWTIFSHGWKAMSWEMVSSLPGGGFYIGKEGGFLNAIVGSLYIVGASTILGLLVSVPVVFYLNVYLKKDSKLAYIARMAFDVLFGVPSIVYGAFAFTVMIFFGLRTSLLGGIIVITMLIIPIFIRTMDEATRVSARHFGCHLFAWCDALGDVEGCAQADCARHRHGNASLCRPRHWGCRGGDVHSRLHRQHTHSPVAARCNPPARCILPTEQSNPGSSGPRLRRCVSPYHYRAHTQYIRTPRDQFLL